LSDLFLIEKYGTIPALSELPEGSIILKKDSDIISTNETTQEELFREVIRSQSDYIMALDPFEHIHSLLKNEAYRAFCDAFIEEQQHFIDYSNKLKTFYDIDFYDGDQSAFLGKIDHLVNFLDISLPRFFENYTNADVSNTLDISRINDFYRRIVKKTYLMRRWAGTLYGYNLPIRLLERDGSVLIAMKYPTLGNVTPFTNRIFRLVNTSSLQKALPSVMGTKFPNIQGVSGIKNISQIGNLLAYKMDMGLQYDYGWDDETAMAPREGNNYSPYKFDQSMSMSSADKQLFLEMTLDKLLYHTNSIGTSQCLLDTPFLRAIGTLLPMVQRAQDKVSVGSQLTLVTSKDGKFNTLSGDTNYSHPSIHAKFQVFKYKNDRITLGWDFNNIYSIKIGQGGFNTPDIDNYVFVPSTEDPADITYQIPTNLQNPIFQAVIGSYEKYDLGNYNLVTTAIHQKNIAATSTATVHINGSRRKNNLKVTRVTLLDQYITPESVSIGVDFDYEKPVFSVNSLSSEITFSLIVWGDDGVGTFSIETVPGGTTPVSVRIGELTISVEPSSKEKVAEDISEDISSEYWSFSNEGATINVITKIIEKHHRLVLFQRENKFKGVVDTLYRWQEQNSEGDYKDFDNMTVPYEYTTTPDLEGYAGKVNSSMVYLLPLTYRDIISEIEDNLEGWWEMSSIEDTLESQNDLTLFGTPISTSGLRGNAYTFNGNDQYATIDSFTPTLKTLSFFYKGTDSGASTSTLATSHLLIGRMLSNNTQMAFGTYIDSNGKCVFRWGNGSDVLQTLTSQTSINDNQWHLITCIHTGTKASLYIDKTMEGAVITTLTTSSLGKFYCMLGGSSGSAYTAGQLQDIRLHSREISIKEIIKIKDYSALLENEFLNSFNKPSMAHIDSPSGKIYMKFQYDASGILKDRLSIHTENITEEVKSTYVKYSVGMSTNQVAISELGLFDINDTMMAYATFPPIIYNPNPLSDLTTDQVIETSFHSAFNLLIQK